MVPITILVAKTSDDILAELILIGIRQRSDIDMACERVVLAHELLTLLSKKENSPNIIILVGREGELAVYSNELLANYPHIVVARIVIGSELVHMDLRQVDLHELIFSVCGVFMRSAISSEQPLTNLFRKRAINSEQRQAEFTVLPNHAAATMGEVPLQIEEVSRRNNALEKALKWIDALLCLQLERASGSGNDMPGLSVSQSTIEKLLQEDSYGTDIHLNESQLKVDATRADLIYAIKESKLHEDPLVALCKGLELTSLEIQAFLLCLAPELNAKYERIYGFMHDDLGRRYATLGLLATLFGKALATRKVLANSSLFKRWRLLGTHGDSFPHGDESLRVDSSIVSWIFGNREAILHDAQLAGVVLPAPWAGASWLDDPADIHFVDTLETFLGSNQHDSRWIVLAGDDGSVWRAILENAIGKLSTRMLRISLAALDGLDANVIDEHLTHVGWAARLTGSIPVIDACDMIDHSVPIKTIKRIVDMFKDTRHPCVLIVRDIVSVINVLPRGDYQLCQRSTLPNSPPVAVFARASAEAGLDLFDTDNERLASAYPLPLDGIDRAVRLAVARGATAEQSRQQQAKILADACRDVACPELPRFATSLEPSFRLDEIVLPPDRHQQLSDIVSHVLHAKKVLNHWGFGAQLPYGKGVAAFFSGPSGTGKTMAARAIGHVLQRSIFSVDLSRVVSKYIGETEKNLDMVFMEAERAGAILLFDEADALFGKRSEVKDAHDRYANIETAYLLQRMEAFSGIAILTSNFGQNMDRAFLRRLRFVVEFPVPDACSREKIWRQCFPPQVPLGEDIDFRFLSRRIEITGGNIRQITLRAAFSAAAESDITPISMRHILQATRAEVLKLGLTGLERELADLAA